jgi:hypothetical protein
VWTVGIAIAIIAVIAIPVGLTLMENRVSPSQTVKLATCGSCAAPDGGGPSSSVGAPLSVNVGQGADATSAAKPSATPTPTPKPKSTPSPGTSPSSVSSAPGSVPPSGPPADEAAVYVSVSYGLLGGYDASVTIEPDPGYSFSSWTLQFSMPGANSSYTSGVSVSHGSVSASGSGSGFSFSGGGSPRSASGCTINGAPCTIEFSG